MVGAPGWRSPRVSADSGSVAELVGIPRLVGHRWEEADACTVVHVDMDAFFAAVEVLDDPTLAGRAVIVGGAGRRGVVAACTYEARAFGIHSAMSSVEARRRCPHAVFVSGRFSRYSEMSARLHGILRRYSPCVEGIGLDEAFVDVRGAHRLLGSPTKIACAMRRAVRDELRLDCAVGVARTKLLAKLASRAAKPTPGPEGPSPGPGVVVVAPSAELDFLHPLPVRALWGVGPATARRLDELGITRVGELAAVAEDALCRAVGGAQGRLLAALARGDDPRHVEDGRVPKSVGHEETFATDLYSHGALRRPVVRMADAVGVRLQESSAQGRTVTVKVRYADRSTITRSRTTGAPTDSPRHVAAVAGVLLGGIDVSRGVRLLGVVVSGLVPRASSTRQLSFDEEAEQKVPPPAGARAGSRDRANVSLDSPGAREEKATAPWHEVEAAVRAIRSRYGHRSVGPAALVGPNGLDVKQRGDTQWGPGAPAGPAKSDR
jgi:DNA polymerase-4